MNLFEIDYIYLDLEVFSKDEFFDFIVNVFKVLGCIIESVDFKKVLEKCESEILIGFGEGLGMLYILDIFVMFLMMLYICLKNEIDY